MQHVSEVPELSSWNLVGLDYASSWRIEISGWQRDPSIKVLAQYLRTQMLIEPLSKFRSLSLVAHSMGGLVVQRALLDDPTLASKVSHVFLFGVPSRGVPAASMASQLKRQISDMAVESKFLASLRSDWSKNFGGGTPFEVVAIAGDTDDFVGASSSIEPFPESAQHVVPGNHSTLVRPDGKDHPGVQLLSSILQGKNSPTYIDSARLAVERRDFKEAIERLMPHYRELDDAALVTLAMALDGMGDDDEALRILDDVYQGGRKTTAEAAGILGGRIKRRWLVERRQGDLTRASELYALGLQLAESEADHDQCYYHAINLAFLTLMGADATADVTTVTRPMCKKALEHCAKAQLNHWRLATEGEAHLMQGNLSAAEDRYRSAVAITDSPRELRSMGDQASLIAHRLGGEELLKAIQSWFLPAGGE